MYFIGVAVTMAGFGLACLLKGVSFANFINPSAVIVIFFTVIGIIVATSDFKIFVRGVNATLSAKYVIGDDDRNAAVELFRLLSKSIVLASVIVPFITVMSTLAHSADLEQATHSLSSALVSPVLGLTLVLAVLEPAVFILKRPRV